MGELYRLDFASGKSYVGVAKNSAAKRYTRHKHFSEVGGGCTLVTAAWRKYGAPRLVVLAVLENDDLLTAEVAAIRVYGTLSPNGYNLTRGGDDNPTSHPRVREKMSKSLKNRVFSEEWKQKLRAAAKNRKPTSAETKEKMRKASLGRAHAPHSEETRKKMSEKAKGRVLSPEAIAKTAAANTGKKRSLETRKKISEALKKTFAVKPLTPEQIERRRKAILGRSLSDEHKRKISESLRGRKKHALHGAAVSAGLSLVPKIACEFCGREMAPWNYVRHRPVCKKDV